MGKKIKVLENHAAVLSYFQQVLSVPSGPGYFQIKHPYTAVVAVLKLINTPEQGTFSGSTGAADNKDISFFNRQTQIVDHLGIVILKTQIRNLDEFSFSHYDRLLSDKNHKLSGNRRFRTALCTFRCFTE
jgi:hypothetical protein